MAEKQVNSENEINLFDLLSSIGKSFVKFLNTAMNIFLFLIVFGTRRIHWLSLFLVVGVGLGVFVFKQTPRFYSSEMIAQPNGFTSIDMAQYINDIHDMCERNNVIGLSNALQIDELSAEQIKDIEAFYLIDVNQDNIGDRVDYDLKYEPEDTTEAIVLTRILIRAEVLDNSIFNEVKKGLIRYIDNNNYLITVNELRKNELEARIDQANAEISKLDSLQNYEYYKNLDDGRTNKEGQIVFLNEKITQLYYRDKETLLGNRLVYQKALELATDPITIIKDFTELQAEENPLASYIIKFGILTTMLGYLLLLILAYKRRIVDFLSTKA